MIKIILKKNLLYLLVFYVSWLARLILTIIIGKQYKRNLIYIYFYIMILAEILEGH